VLLVGKRTKTPEVGSAEGTRRSSAAAVGEFLGGHHVIIPARSSDRIVVTTMSVAVRPSASLRHGRDLGGRRLTNLFLAAPFDWRLAEELEVAVDLGECSGLSELRLKASSRSGVRGGDDHMSILVDQATLALG
jgi:hypothetical protein